MWTIQALLLVTEAFHIKRMKYILDFKEMLEGVGIWPQGWHAYSLVWCAWNQFSAPAACWYRAWQIAVIAQVTESLQHMQETEVEFLSPGFSAASLSDCEHMGWEPADRNYVFLSNA